ncbi:MAG TPA: VanW family protein [Polyangiaceae bacterium]|nr:VanW family protein [Polyangiaceae bacterium]
MVLRFPSRTRVLATCGLLASLGLLSVPLYRHFLPSDDLAPGLTIDGVAAGLQVGRGEPRTSGGQLESFVRERARALSERKITLVAHDGAADRVVLETTLGELGVRVDEERVVHLARAVGRQGALSTRVAACARARRGELDVPLGPSVDIAVLSAAVARIKETEDTPPLSARLDVEKRTPIPERTGYFVDLDATRTALAELAEDLPSRAEPAKLVLPMQYFAPRTTSAFVQSIDVHTVMSEYVTYFSRHNDQSRRGQNIDMAASKLNGLVLSPGELVSFNDVVGERSEENGFQKSWEIFKGEMKEGVGGGTCQVASTVHAAAFFAGLDIVERLPHSRPSAYIPMGLDATVVYPIVDMKLRNPFKFPVVLHAAVEGNRLRVAMLGRSRPASVSFSREVVETRAYPRKVEESPTAAAGKVIVKQHGIFGYRIERERILRFRGGKERVEKNKDFYPPTTEIYDVPPGFDVSLLPPLPTVTPDDAADPTAAAPLATNVTAPNTPPAPTSLTERGGSAWSTLPATPIMEDAPGSHAPTSAQSRPIKKVTIRR